MLGLTPMQLSANGVSVIIIILLAINGQQKAQKNFLLFQVITNALYVLHYVLLSATTAAVIAVTCVLRALIFYVYKKKQKRVPRWLLIVVFAVVIACGIWTWDNWLSIIPVIAAISYTYGQYHEELNITRKTMILGDIMWIIYNCFFFGFVNVITKVVTISSVMIAMHREKKLKN